MSKSRGTSSPRRPVCLRRRRGARYLLCGYEWEGARGTRNHGECAFAESGLCLVVAAAMGPEERPSDAARRALATRARRANCAGTHQTTKSVRRPEHYEFNTVVSALMELTTRCTVPVRHRRHA